MMWFRARGAWIGRRLRTKRRIATLVFVVFLAVLIIAWFLPIHYIYSPPQSQLPVTLYGGTRIGSNPFVTYEMNVLFTTSGGFSVGNPVTVWVDLTYPNDTNFLASYCCASVSNAVNIPEIKVEGNASAIVFADRIPLTAYPNGSYIGTAPIRFTEPGNQSIALALTPNLTNPQLIVQGPTNIKGLPYPYNESEEGSVIDVSDSSGTLGIASTQFIARITLLIGAFSVVLLQPVLEALILPPDQRPPRAQSPPPAPTNSPPPKPTESTGRMNRKERRLRKRQQREEKESLQKSEG
jgi:hypothetical protein